MREIGWGGRERERGGAEEREGEMKGRRGGRGRVRGNRGGKFTYFSLGQITRHS